MLHAMLGHGELAVLGVCCRSESGVNHSKMRVTLTLVPSEALTSSPKLSSSKRWRIDTSSRLTTEQRAISYLRSEANHSCNIVIEGVADDETANLASAGADLEDEDDADVDCGERQHRNHPRVAREQHHAVEVAVATAFLLAGPGAAPIS